MTNTNTIKRTDITADFLDTASAAALGRVCKLLGITGYSKPKSSQKSEMLEKILATGILSENAPKATKTSEVPSARKVANAVRKLTPERRREICADLGLDIPKGMTTTKVCSMIAANIDATCLPEDIEKKLTAKPARNGKGKARASWPTEGKVSVAELEAFIKKMSAPDRFKRDASWSLRKMTNDLTKKERANLCEVSADRLSEFRQGVGGCTRNSSAFIVSHVTRALAAAA